MNITQRLIAPLSIVCLAMLLRLGYIAVAPRDVQFENVDARGYHWLAVNLLERRVFSMNTEPPFRSDDVRAPLYPLFVAALYSVTGPDPRVVALMQAALDSVTVAVAFRLGRRVAGWRVGLLTAQHGFDIDQLAAQYTRVYDKPFDSEDRYMAAGFALGDQTLYFAKGDPDVILKMCTGYMTATGSVRRMEGTFLGAIRAATDSANQRGDIAIALGYSPGTTIPPKRYTFLCLIQLQNPLRPGVPDKVRWLKNMGIRPLMLTGDRPEAAMAVGKQTGIGLDSRYCLTGKDIAQMALQEVAWWAAHESIFARLSPSQKGILVRLLQQRGHSVAMVGDGANDIIALRVADVGFSFGESSSPLAKRVSKILIHDLADLLTIIAGAKRIERWLKYLMLFRVAALISMLVGLYAWMLG